jgi:hypothetical protein
MAVKTFVGDKRPKAVIPPTFHCHVDKTGGQQPETTAQCYRNFLVNENRSIKNGRINVEN